MARSMPGAGKQASSAPAMMVLAGGGDERKDDGGVERDVTGALAHQQDGDGQGAQTAEDGGAGNTAHEGGSSLLVLWKTMPQSSAPNMLPGKHRLPRPSRLVQQGGDGFSRLTP